MKKQAIAEVSAIELCPKEEVTWVKVVHRKGDKTLFGLKEYKEDLFLYKNVTRFHSVEDLANFIGKSIMIDDENKIWIVPQILTTYPSSAYSATKKIKVYDTDESAEEAFKHLVEKYHLTEVK